MSPEQWGRCDDAAVGGVLSFEMNRACVAVAALMGASLLASGCGSGRQATSVPGLTGAKLVKLAASVRAMAKANGDAHPSGAMIYASRRHEANIAAGAGTGVFGEQPVYLVVVRGQFVCNSCSGPRGHIAPRGNIITTVVDRKTLQGLDFGIGGRVDTSKLGPGLPLALGSR
jgi:hypothetical protein